MLFDDIATITSTPKVCSRNLIEIFNRSPLYNLKRITNKCVFFATLLFVIKKIALFMNGYEQDSKLFIHANEIMII